MPDGDSSAGDHRGFFAAVASLPIVAEKRPNCFAKSRAHAALFVCRNANYFNRAGLTSAAGRKIMSCRAAGVCPL